MQKLREWIKNLKPEQKIAVVHDRDADGMCAALLVMKGFERLNLPRPVRLNQKLGEKTITQATIRKLRKLCVTAVITTDMAVDQNPLSIKELEKFCKVLVFDHHKPSADIHSDKTTVIRSQDFTEKYCPTSKLVFDLFEKITTCSGLEWVASVGTIADGGYEQWKDVVDYTIKTKGTTFDDLKKIGVVIGSVSLHEDEQLIDALFWKIYEADHPIEVASDKEYEQYINDIDNEIERWFKKHKQKAKFVGDRIYYKLKPKYSVSSPLSTKLWDVYPNKTIVLVQDRGKKFLEISLRRQDSKVDVAALVQELIKDLPEAKGGGHPRAAGGKILRKSLKEFEKRLQR
ncbi:DHH family phosphoesterase [Candidatus Woesearchaeota archaeon]|nr:DHH family phosphoesterase [Candidatus Woesearchaeota archaeon]